MTNPCSILRLVMLMVSTIPVIARRPFGDHNNAHSMKKTFPYPHAEAAHRHLQTDQEVCDFILEEGFNEDDRPFCTCERLQDMYQVDCRFTDCPDCEDIQGVSRPSYPLSP